MTEASISDITPDQNVQQMEDNCCDIKPEQRMQEIESSQSDTCPDLKAQMTEVDQNTHTADTDQNTQMTDVDMIPDQKAQLAEDSSEMIPDLKGKLIYRCRKCRQIVASEENLVSHDQGKGGESFRGKKMSVERNAPECTAIFVEPLKWMVPVEEGYLYEKLYCIGCKSKIGSFTWVGMQCSCGAWVRPAFQIIKSRIDECRI